MLLCQHCSFLFPLICWSFCSKKLCTPEPSYKLEVSPKELLSALVSFCFVFCLFFPIFSFGYVVGLHTTPSEYYSAPLLLWNTNSELLKGLTLDSAFSLTLYYLNRCTFVAPALTGAPPRWFISPVGLLAAAGDQTEEPGLSHQGNESEKREGGEEHNCLSAASLCSQTTLCPHLSIAHMHTNPISTTTEHMVHHPFCN